MATENLRKSAKVVLVLDVLYDPDQFETCLQRGTADSPDDKADLRSLVKFADARLVNQCGDAYQITDVTVYTVNDFLEDHAAGRINNGVPTGMTHADWAKEQFLRELEQ